MAAFALQGTHPSTGSGRRQGTGGGAFPFRLELIAVAVPPPVEGGWQYRLLAEKQRFQELWKWSAASSWGSSATGIYGGVAKNATYATMARYSGSGPLLLQRATTTSPYQELIHASAPINNAEEVLQI